ncbi:hypothetical protein D3C86_1879660 [compost metagenome]
MGIKQPMREAGAGSNPRSARKRSPNMAATTLVPSWMVTSPVVSLVRLSQPPR